MNVFASYKQTAVVALRCVQLICVASVVTGFIWSSGDFMLTTVLVGVPVTPLSILLMLYGTVGSLLIEGIVRFFNRKNGFLPENRNEKTG